MGLPGKFYINEIPMTLHGKTFELIYKAYNGSRDLVCFVFFYLNSTDS